MAENPHTPPRINKLIELEVSGRIKPQHQQELDTYRAQGLAPKKSAGAGTEGERKASAFLSRALGANRSYEETGVGPRGLAHEFLSDNAPDLTNVAINSPERQIANSAQDEFIAASLRQDSGAAIPPEELERQRRIYFPMPGDLEPNIKQKRMARLRAIDGLVQSAGSGLTSAQKEYLSKIQADLRAAVTGDEPAGAVEGEKEVVGLQEGAERAIEDAAGMNDGARMSVDIPADGSSQSPEFRAGLQKLLDDPNSTKQDILDYWNKNAPGALNGGEPPAAAPLATERGKNGVVENVDALVRGAADTATLGFADEIAAAGRTIFDEGTMAENLRRERGVDRYDEENNPIFRGVGQLAGAVAPVGAGRIGLGARGPRDLAIAGGGLGALYGVGSGETLSERITGAGAGGVAGAAGGLVLGKLSDYIGQRRGSPPSGPTPGQEVLAAGRAENIPMNAADVNPGARNSVAYLESTPGGSGPVRANMNAANDAMAERVESLGAGGMDVGELGVGEALQKAGQRFIAKSRPIKDRMYTRAEELAGDTRVQSKNAVDVLDARIARLSEIPNSSKGELKLLNDLRADLVDEAGNLKPLSVGAIRDLRTSMRGEIGSRNLTMSSAEKNVSDVLDAAALDIAAALDKSAPNAAAAFRRADNFYKDRQKKINDVIQRFTGPKGSPMSAEQAFRKLESMSSPKGDSKRLAEMMGTLSREERADVAATIAARLGQRTAEDEFSPALFIGHAAKLSPSARQTIFGAEGAKTISNLMKVATAKRDTARSLNNSRSGQVGNYARMLSSVFLGTGAGAIAGGPVGAVVGGALAAGAGMGARNITARVLMNPRVAEWAAQGVKIKGSFTSPQAQKHVAKLSQIATKDPTIRNEVIQLQQRLVDSFGVSPATRAAAEDEQPVRGEPVR